MHVLMYVHIYKNWDQYSVDEHTSSMHCIRTIIVDDGDPDLFAMHLLANLVIYLRPGSRY